MIGKFVVYEGVFFDRMSVRETVGETAQFWIVKNCKNLDRSRLKKSSLGPSAFFETEREALKVANRTTDKLLKARKHFEARRLSIFGELRNTAMEKV
jgi:hypothetical protein